MRRPLVIYGAGGFGREVAQLVEDINCAGGKWQLLGFIDDDRSLHGSLIGELPVLGNENYLCGLAKPPAVALGVGFPRAKREIVQKLTRRCPGIEFPSLVHPSAIIGRRVRIGTGTLITANCVITVDVEIGNFVLLNLSSTVGHDAVIGDFSSCYVNVNLAGFSKLEDGVEMGTGSIVIPGKKVGSGSVIGAGAVVVNDVPEDVVAVGVPARVVKQVEEPWRSSLQPSMVSG